MPSCSGVGALFAAAFFFAGFFLAAPAAGGPPPDFYVRALLGLPRNHSIAARRLRRHDLVAPQLEPAILGGVGRGPVAGRVDRWHAVATVATVGRAVGTAERELLLRALPGAVPER